MTAKNKRQRTARCIVPLQETAKKTKRRRAALERTAKDWRIRKLATLKVAVRKALQRKEPGSSPALQKRRGERCFAPPLQYGKRKNTEKEPTLKVSHYRKNRRSRAT